MALYGGLSPGAILVGGGVSRPQNAIEGLTAYGGGMALRPNCGQKKAPMMGALSTLGVSVSVSAPDQTKAH
jgi:hypothetical protein